MAKQREVKLNRYSGLIMSTYHVRVRGRVQGPYTEEQLRIFIQRGQVSRIHEVSLDQTSWNKISEFPELFQGSNGFDGIPAANENLATGQASGSNRIWEEAQGPNSSIAGSWYYYLLGQKKGPISAGELEQLMRQNQCGPTTLIWTQGMSDWMPANTVVHFQHLWPYSAGTSQGQADHVYPDATASSNATARDVSRNLTESRVWISIILIQGYAGLAFLIVNFALTFVAMLRNRGPAFMASTIFVLTLLPIVVVLVLLTRYWSSLGSLKGSNNENGLVTAARNLKHYWMALGIMSLIGLICIVALTVLFFAGVLDTLSNQSFRDI